MIFKMIAMGIYRIEGGTSAPSIIDLEARPHARSNALDGTIDECLQSSAQVIAKLTKGEISIDPTEWSLAASVDPEILTGHSFGLAILGSMLAVVLGTGTRDFVACTGHVSSDGKILGVGGVKEKLAAEHGARFLIVPRENDPHETLTASGVRILRPETVEECLWLMLGTGYLAHLVRYATEDADKEVARYFERCWTLGVVPEGIGELARRSVADSESTLGQVIRNHRREWESHILRLAPLSGPDPSDLLQAVFPETDWTAISAQQPPQAERMVADLARDLVIGQHVELARDLCHLALFGRGGPKLLLEHGPFRQFLKWAEERFESDGDKQAFQTFFAGSNGMARRILAAETLDSDLESAITRSPFETEVIHQLVEGRVELSRFVYRLEGRQLDFSLKYPMALFDHSGSVPDFMRKAGWSPNMDAMLSHPEGSVVSRFFSRQTFVLNRFQTRLLWTDGIGCWPPSIDSLHFLADVFNNGLHLADSPSAKMLDLCCGCGVVGISLAKIGNFSAVDFIDIDANACATTRINIRNNLFDQDSGWETSLQEGERIDSAVTDSPPLPRRTFRVHQGQATRILRRMIDDADGSGPLYDRVFFTPPYVPDPEQIGVPMWRATAGTELLEECIAYGPTFCRELIFTYSTIAAAAVNRGIRRNHAIEEDYLLGSHWVALRIPGFVHAFQTIPDGEKAGELPHRAQRYWQMYLEKNLRDTGELQEEGLLHHDGHGFRFAQEIVTRRIVFGD